MSIGAIGGGTHAVPQDNKEITTITTNCNNEECEKKQAHNRSCPHTVSTRPAPRVGEKGYLLDKTV